MLRKPLFHVTAAAREKSHPSGGGGTSLLQQEKARLSSREREEEEQNVRGMLRGGRVMRKPEEGKAFPAVARDHGKEQNFLLEKGRFRLFP